jgi:hypothetical protein
LEKLIKWLKSTNILRPLRNHIKAQCFRKQHWENIFYLATLKILENMKKNCACIIRKYVLTVNFHDFWSCQINTKNQIVNNNA